MGNRYRCAGSASETYINNERVYDRVDIKTPNQPNISPFTLSFAELNGLMYIAWFYEYESYRWDLYTFDGVNFTKYASFSDTIYNLCAFNNTLYVLQGVKLYRLSGTSLTYVTDLPSDGNHHNYKLFVLGSYLYLLSYNSSDTNYIHRFTGSGWTQVATTSKRIDNATIALYNGAIHIMYYGDYTPPIKTHLIFNGSTLVDGAELPGEIQEDAAYVINNKLRVFRKFNEYGDEESGVDVYELSGNTWSQNTVLNFEGWVNKKSLLRYIQAFYYKNEQYLLNVMESLIIKITNPIRLGQYFISS